MRWNRHLRPPYVNAFCERLHGFSAAARPPASIVMLRRHTTRMSN
ncbi:hypothetical protein Rumeso_03319 [Rubellimicrobium mesophilum DSM 19309]|uniref:Uncharacterized protein n=1 Tax=Rubellimicrobium mesophilum DSM 19309 TaxID=442562 RepID=A0A017HL91_9RHOB|nr:hypothetical protein Rumeso_03319 [Rubellimicrobium mesophilum DSM 19309]